MQLDFFSIGVAEALLPDSYSKNAAKELTQCFLETKTEMEKKISLEKKKKERH